MAYDRLKALLEANEGRVSFLYADSGGIPTIGIGHALPSAQDAIRLPLVVRTGASATPPIPATANEKQLEWQTIKSKPSGKVAGFYEPFTALILPADAIDGLLNEDIQAAVLGLTTGMTAIAGFMEFPEPAQEALLDIAFNCGVEGLHSGFPKLVAAAERRDWATCAAESRRRPPVSEARNKAVYDLFMEAAG